MFIFFSVKGQKCNSVAHTWSSPLRLATKISSLAISYLSIAIVIAIWVLISEMPASQT